MFRAAVAVIAFAFSSLVNSQTVTPQQVQLLAPQLLAFAGSSANFAALVSGMALGIPVTLLTPTIDGQLQVATFTPPATASAADIARSLEAARSSLIARGIAAPTAQQIAVALMGGALPTSLGAVQVPGVLTGTANVNAVQVRNDFAAFTRQGNTLTFGSGSQAQTFSVPGAALSDLELQQSLLAANQLLAQLGIFNPTPAQLRSALIGGPLSVANGATLTLQGVLQGRVSNTSDSRVFGTSNSPTIGTSNTPPTASGAIPTPSADTGVPRGNTAEGANRAIRRGG